MGCLVSTPEKYDAPPGAYSQPPPQNYAAALAQNVVNYASNYATAAPAAAAAPSQLCEVLFFPDPALPCRNAQNPGGCRRGAACTFSHDPTSLSRLLQYIAAARQTLLICVFTITADDIADAILNAHRRGVQVRVITDNDQASTNGSDIAKLQAAGVPLRTDKEATHMHHKFCVMDGRIVMNGSFNWTRQAVLGNQENVVIQDHPTLVREFTNRFEYLWNMYR